MVDVNVENLRQSDLAKLPLYAGDVKDQFTAEQWIERISRSCTASNWTADQTMAFVFNALRGNALRWFDALKRSGINRNNWDAFQQAFLAAFSTTRTPRMATVNLADLHQSQTEQVVSFYPRIIKAVDDLEALAGAAFPLPDPPFPVEFTNVPGFAALAVPVRAAAAQALVTFGAASFFNYIALNLFVSNLRPSLRDELLKTPPATLYGAFEAASQLERLQETPKRPTASAMAIDGASSSTASAVPADADVSTDGLDKEIDALNFRLKALKNRRTSTRPSASGRQQQQQQQPRSGPPRSTPARDPNFKCRTAGAPMVAADGTPYKPAATAPQARVHQVVESPLTFVPQQGTPQGYPPGYLQGYSQGYAAAPPSYQDFHYAE